MPTEPSLIASSRLASALRLLSSSSLGFLRAVSPPSASSTFKIQFAALNILLRWMLAIGSSAAVLGFAQPIDNPVATRYGASAYPWTDEIRWTHVFNVADYGAVADGNYTTSNGTDNTAAFNAARDAAAAAGGGVVYFPPGTYAFADHLYLKNGVVIRGADPTGVTDARNADFNPPSKLVFPAYLPLLSGNGTPNSSGFKKIYTTAGDTDSNMGVVNVDLNRCMINLQGAPNTGRNRNLVVLGVRSNNVAEPDPGVPTSWQHAWQRWSNRFAANIRIQAYANVLVANCRVNDAVTDTYEQPGYRISSSGEANGTITTLNGTQARFNYTDHYGIVINRSGASGYLAPHPLTEPSLFRPGIVVRDNYIFHTMRVAIHVAGQGLEILDNVVRDQPGKTHWLHPTGLRSARNSQTLENRAIDWAGWDVLVSGNDLQVYRHLLNGGPYLSVDGEGILIQECCGGTLVNGITIANNTVNSYIGLYKMQDIRDAVIVDNSVSGSASGLGVYVVANTNSGNYTLENVVVANNTLSDGTLIVTGNVTGANVTVRDNRDGDATPSNAILSDYIVNANNTGFGNLTSLASFPRNRSPYVRLTRPALANVHTAAGLALEIEAEALDPDGSVASVQFYNHQTLLATDTTPPYTHTLGSPAPGEYMLTARAYDNLGRSYVSWPVYLRVTEAPRIDQAIVATGPGPHTGKLLLEIRRPAPPTDLLFSIESSATLAPDSWTPTPFTELSVEREGPNERIWIRDDSPGAPEAPAHFLRLRTQRP